MASRRPNSGEVIAEGLLAQAGTDLNKAGIAGDCQPLGKGFQPVDMSVGTPETGARHIDGPGTDKLAVWRAGTGVQCRGGGDQLEDTAGSYRSLMALLRHCACWARLQGFAALLPLQRIDGVADFFIDNRAGSLGS